MTPIYAYSSLPTSKALMMHFHLNSEAFWIHFNSTYSTEYTQRIKAIAASLAVYLAGSYSALPIHRSK
jgi:hypothetical protein